MFIVQNQLKHILGPSIYRVIGIITQLLQPANASLIGVYSAHVLLRKYKHLSYHQPIQLPMVALKHLNGSSSHLNTHLSVCLSVYVSVNLPTYILFPYTNSGWRLGVFVSSQVATCSYCTSVNGSIPGRQGLHRARQCLLPPCDLESSHMSTPVMYFNHCLI